MVSIRVKQGIVRVGEKIKLMNTGAVYEVTELGVKTPKEVKKNQLVADEVGWLAESIKMIRDVRVGDTITTVANPAQHPLPGYKKINPMVFCVLYPIDSAKYKD